jgi:hypothetical protein
MYTVTFEIDLLHAGNYFQTAAEKEQVTETQKTLYLPVGKHGGTPFVTGKHGDQFTREGLEAVYLKKLVEGGQVFGIKLAA